MSDRRIHRAKKALDYIAAKQVAATAQPGCNDIDSAIRQVRQLGSLAARDWSTQERMAVAEAVADYLIGYAEYVERVERGCQRLLLQAAEQIGERHVHATANHNRHC